MNNTRKQFIRTIAPIAVKVGNLNNISPALIIAQAILESRNGNSKLAYEYNNLFGVKGKGNAGSVELATKEFINGKETVVSAIFRVYKSWEDSLNDHAKLITNGVSWDPYKYHKVLGKSAIFAADEIAKAGYATDPKYADKLKDLIVSEGLLSYEQTNIVNIEKDDPIITEFEELLNDMKNRIHKLELEQKQIPAPHWVLEKYPNIPDILTNKQGTYDFWRAIYVAISYLENKEK